MPSPARLLLDLLTESLPEASAVPAWAGQTSQLMMDVHPGDRLVPTPAWRAQVLSRLSHGDTLEALPIWVQVIAFAWASPAQAIHGSVERVLLHWWSNVPAHDWPTSWPVSPLEMALDHRWQALAVRMCEHPHPGLPMPVLNAALAARLGVDLTHYAHLRTIRPETAQLPPWKQAGQCVDPAGLRALLGQDVSVPAPTVNDPYPHWPEEHWPENSVSQWPAMETAIDEVRATHPAAQAQGLQARQYLVVRALNLGHRGVAHQLGWGRWLRTTEPLTWVAGPAEPQRSVLDGLGRNKQLSHPERLSFALDHVFQPALEAGRVVLWRGAAGKRSPGVSPPGLRFWNRALNDALAGRLPPVSGQRGPLWWCALMQERAELWSQGLWQSLASTATARWWCWWRLTIEQATGNPLHLASVVAVGAPAASLVGAPFPWEQMVPAQEAAWSLACAHQLSWLTSDQWDQPEVRGTLAIVMNRWRNATERRSLWVPFLWAWLGLLEAQADERTAAVADRWWRRLNRWGHQNPTALQDLQAHDHAALWTTVAHPGVRARWRSLLGSVESPVRERPRSRA